MKTYLKTTALAVTAAVGTYVATPAQVQAQGYQIDCAILLCLSGGWPASVPCTRARAEFIRRITPWPVEPPLQIWRCPMSISYDGPTQPKPMDQIYEILAPAAPLQSYPDTATFTGSIEPTLAVDIREDRPTDQNVDKNSLPEGIRLYLAQAVGTGADIDLSDPAFDYIKSIDVFQVTLSQRDGREDCHRRESVRHGSYEPDGQFVWRNSDYRQIPPAFMGEEGYRIGCRSVNVRAVFVDWNDFEGNYGFEQVNY